MCAHCVLAAFQIFHVSREASVHSILSYSNHFEKCILLHDTHTLTHSQSQFYSEKHTRERERMGEERAKHHHHITSSNNIIAKEQSQHRRRRPPLSDLIKTKTPSYLHLISPLRHLLCVVLYDVACSRISRFLPVIHIRINTRTHTHTHTGFRIYYDQHSVFMCTRFAHSLCVWSRALCHYFKSKMIRNHFPASFVPAGCAIAIHITCIRRCI